jgi:membrane protein DedA with SNARE-associated domain
MDTTQASLNGPSRLVAETPPEESGIVAFVTDLVEKLGGPGAGIAVALENLFPPIPSEVILPLAGFAASRGELSLASAIIWTTIGSVVGAVALYYIGAMLGRDRVRGIVARLPLVKLADVDRTEAWFVKHGVKAVFFGRMIPIFRSLISIPAGLERMPIATFLLYTTLGSLIWNSLFILAGYSLGEKWTQIEGWVGTYQNIIIVVCVLIFAWFVVSRIRKARRRGAEETPAADGFFPPPTAGAEPQPYPMARPEPQPYPVVSPEPRQPFEEAQPYDGGARPERAGRVYRSRYTERPD